LLIAIRRAWATALLFPERYAIFRLLSLAPRTPAGQKPTPMLRSLHLYQGLLIGPLLCAQYTATVKTSVTPVESPGWKKWSDKECVINYPSNWTDEGSLGTSAIATFFAPADSTGGFRERVLLTSLNASGKTMTELCAAMEAQNLLGFTDAQKTASETTADAATMELLGTIDGQPVRLKRELSLRGNKAWILTYVAAATRYEDALYLADAMFMSFAVK
jgi:hypothetical protein